MGVFLSIPGAATPQYLLDYSAALALINARRAADGLQPLPEQSAAPLPDSQPVKEDSSHQAGAGQRLLDLRRAEFQLNGLRSGQQAGRASTGPDYSLPPVPHVETITPQPLPLKPVRSRLPWKEKPCERLRVLPQLGFATEKARLGGAWRLWSAARWLDKAGSGVVWRDELVELADSLGVGKRSLQRWLCQALRQGWLKPVTRRDGRVALLLEGVEKVAVSLDCENIGARWAEMRIDYLFSASWRAWVWGAFLATFEGRAISRLRLRQISGVPESTQLEWERSLPVQYHRNIAVSRIPGEYAPQIRELEGRKSAFAFRGGKKKKGQARVAWRLPDNRLLPENAGSAGCRGRLRKVNRKLSANTGSCNVERASGGVGGARLFYDRANNASKALRRFQRRGTPVNEVYVRRSSALRVGIWEPLICDNSCGY
jgi:hypothetical protein